MQIASFRIVREERQHGAVTVKPHTNCCDQGNCAKNVKNLELRRSWSGLVSGWRAFSIHFSTHFGKHFPAKTQNVVLLLFFKPLYVIFINAKATNSPSLPAAGIGVTKPLLHSTATMMTLALSPSTTKYLQIYNYRN